MSFKDKAKKMLSGSKFSKNTNMVVLIVVVVAVAILLNVVLELLPLDIDMTTEKLYTLTDTTKTVLKDLDNNVKIYALYDEVSGRADVGKGGRAEIMKVLDLYDQSNRVSVEYVNVNKKPQFLANLVGEAAASNYAEGDYVVCCDKNIRHIQAKDLYVVETQNDPEYFFQQYKITTGVQAETKFTSSILKVVSEVPVIYYSMGFGETSMKSYSILMNYVQNSGFDIVEFDLKTNQIPDNAACLMFFGPTEDLTDSAYDKLERWMLKGGSAFFFMDVKSLTDDHVIYRDFENFNRLFGKYGIKLEKTLVEEQGSQAIADTGDDVAFKADTRPAGSLENMTKMTMTVLNSRSMDLDNMSDEYETEAILATTAEAVARAIETDNDTRTGISTVAASGKCFLGTATSRICVFGSSQSFSDMALKFFGETAAEQVIINSMDWMNLAAQKNVGDSITARTYNNAVKSAVITTRSQMNVITVITMIVIPLLVVAGGIVIWLRRRHL